MALDELFCIEISTYNEFIRNGYEKKPFETKISNNSNARRNKKILQRYKKILPRKIYQY